LLGLKGFKSAFSLQISISTNRQIYSKISTLGCLCLMQSIEG